MGSILANPASMMGHLDLMGQLGQLQHSVNNGFSTNDFNGNGPLNGIGAMGNLGMQQMLQQHTAMSIFDPMAGMKPPGFQNTPMNQNPLLQVG
jgi:hypothetical protein